MFKYQPGNEIYGGMMKRFKELNSSQKKKAVDHLYRRGMRDLRWNGAGYPERVKERLKEITSRIKFCGCGDCEIKLSTELNKDSVIKEFVLDSATKEAESAYYPEPDDTLITVN